jgi:hypothetical protein
MSARLTAGSEVWYFGPDWPGARCGAKTRSGQPCKNAKVTGRKRCRMHGGAAGSGAPTGERNGRFKHGRYTKERVALVRKETAHLKGLFQLGKSLGMFR